MLDLFLLFFYNSCFLFFISYKECFLVNFANLYYNAIFIFNIFLQLMLSSHIFYLSLTRLLVIFTSPVSFYSYYRTALVFLVNIFTAKFWFLFTTLVFYFQQIPAGCHRDVWDFSSLRGRNYRLLFWLQVPSYQCFN